MDYQVISTDDHLQEAPHCWTSRMSKSKWDGLIPQIKRDADGTDHWYIHGKKIRGGGVGSVRGLVPVGQLPLRWEDVPRKAYDPAERVKAMSEDGVDVHTFFGNIAGVAGNAFSDPTYPEDFRLEAIKAYNDYQIEEWATPYPGRFITLCDLPMWDVDLAIDELNRMAALDVKGVSFAFPEQFGYPSIDDRYWDPLWSVIQDADLSINFHVGSGASMGIPSFKPLTHASSQIYVSMISTRVITANVEVMTYILFSGILERFPRIKIVSSESGIGWVPYLLEVADHQWEAQDLRNHGMGMKPSDYFHRQCFVNFWFEQLGPQLRHIIGVDNIMWESDFPHGTGTYPHSREYIEKSTEGWTPEEKRKVLVETPAALYHLGG